MIYFDPKDSARAIPLNILDSPGHEFDGLVVDNVMGIFKKLWPDAFTVGARIAFSREYCRISKTSTITLRCHGTSHLL